MTLRRNNFPRSRARKTYKWCGHNQLVPVNASTAVSLAQIPDLCPALDSTLGAIPGDVVIEKIRLNVTMRRLLVTGVQASAFIVAIQKIDVTTGNPLEVLNALDVTDEQHALGNKDILMLDLLPVPACIRAQADDTLLISLENIVTRYEFNGRRKLSRLNHAVTFMPVADVSSALDCFVQSRILLRYS